MHRFLQSLKPIFCCSCQSFCVRRAAGRSSEILLLCSTEEINEMTSWTVPQALALVSVLFWASVSDEWTRLVCDEAAAALYLRLELIVALNSPSDTLIETEVHTCPVHETLLFVLKNQSRTLISLSSSLQESRRDFIWKMKIFLPVLPQSEQSDGWMNSSGHSVSIV